MISETQAVYHLTKIEDYKSIKCFQEPIPKIENNEILVKIRAVTLNYRDIVIANGQYPASVAERVIPGSDAAGDVVQVGSKVTGFKVGDKVVNTFDPNNLYGTEETNDSALGACVDGVMCQYRVFTSTEVLKLPEDTHLSYEEAASLVCAGVTAWNCLYGGGKPFIAGQTVLFLGTGGVSICGLIFAKAAGAVTIITSSSDKKIEHVKEKYGADYGVNYNTHPDWEKEVLKITKGKGVDVVIENGGSGTIVKSLASVRPGGQIGLVGFLSQADEITDLIIPIMKKGAMVRGIQVGSRQLFEELLQFVHAKKLRLPIEHRFGFSEEQVHSAYEKLVSQTGLGKIAIINDDN